jgi:hypothetical protein
VKYTLKLRFEPWLTGFGDMKTLVIEGKPTTLNVPLVFETEVLSMFMMYAFTAIVESAIEEATV